MPDSPGTPSRLVAGRYPPPGTDPVADRIRARRGARGLTPLDANLLHFPAMAAGYNDLLGALRTGGRLPGDVRELMILRIAALNNAAFEWVQHEPIGRTEGLTTGQLYIIRDIGTPLPAMPGMLSPLQSVALEFTDAVTRGLNFTIPLGERYKAEITKWAESTLKVEPGELEKAVEDLYVEACMVVAGYNMVSRFLVSTDVNGLTGTEVPWPLERFEDKLEVPSYPSIPSTHAIHTIALKQPSPDAEWLLFANSLLTSTQMWSYIIPFFLDGRTHFDATTGAPLPPPTHPTPKYNIILHDQRGHGLSSLPPPQSEGTRQTTIPLLAQDIQHLLLSPELRTLIDGSPTAPTLKPIKSIIGVSQGGAAALAFAAALPAFQRTASSIIACDTAAKTPAGNKAAWEDRVRLVYGDGSNTNSKDDAYAAKVGLGVLADATLPRWFPAGSPLSPERAAFTRDMVVKTNVKGFVAGSQALGEYDVLQAGLFDSPVERVLLLAGSLDGGGKVGQGLRNLKAEWNSDKVEYAEVEKSGHLPMLDQPEKFCEVVGKWLAGETA